ncbi:PTS fructose transporter subunit IIABC [Arthrobacter woluwensis]|uniref:PTS system D-fructose-specific IIA component (F1P-forming), Frc family /PTS system D-fructose-specific IIB component (F1P-forming), Frc family /PTS system D-fructose-specific IIC component (F1P-for... n=1 Tax=Arthrobacter woluwensis TaxID=156980 RepID=A0A1H4JKY6_9MICC|nr:fructose-specific PTS transporter subunit EIIC [Arthrobacter woluwensis]SEB46338.1 PTS system D-fructose-specific IIA component (F1P-forming), Frc family /PTS system D-fructose-specific IIB component (F1P-forming), Frc family /PTS system D-fructose-specific IIC component (F1P-forming), Frc family [Arthrobacter woluwensis]
MSQMITPDLVVLDADLGSTPADVIRTLSGKVAALGRAEAEGLFASALAREEKTPTGIPGGIAIPHAKTDAVTEPALAMARLGNPVPFGAKDGPADLIFLIAAPAGADQEHLKLLSKLARSLIKKDFTAALRAAASPEEIVALVEGALSDAPKAAPAASTADAGAPAAAAPAAGAASAASAAPSSAPAAEGPRRIVAVTACPTGIAHTYMSADSLAAAGKEMGVDVQVETQGSAGATPLPADVIANADAVIFAVDVDVRDKDRFAGLPYIQSPVKRGIDEPKEMIEEALAAAKDPNSRRVRATGSSSSSDADTAGESVGAKLKRALLTGVSYMIPFVAGGGLLIALGFLLGGFDITKFADTIVVKNNLFSLPTEFGDHALGPLGAYLGAVLFKIGALSMSFLVPALAGYIAYALADRPGIAPGFVVGAVAGFMGAGFLGGIVGGLLAGYTASWLGQRPAPRWLRGLMPVVIIPLVASIVASGLMFVVLGGPIAWLTTALNNWLTGMSGAAAIVLGIVLGLMMCFDLGGPVNKVAYSFAAAGLSAGTADNHGPYLIMAAVMGAGMVPPLGMALATVLRPKLFTAAEHENGKAAWLLGASFISEGAIPFAAADPLRVIPASMLGGAVTGALSMAFAAGSRAPHGGVFVFFAFDNFLLWILSIAVGAVITGFAVVGLKGAAARKAEVRQAQEAVAV